MKILIEVLKNLFTKPFTRRYPLEKALIQPRFRGKIFFVRRNCIGCRLCEIKCPAGAIKFIKKGRINFDLGKCTFCGICADVCPSKPKAIKFTTAFEYSTEKKAKLTVR